MSTGTRIHLQQSTTQLNIENGLAFLAGAVGFVLSFFHWYGVSTAGSAVTYLNGWHGWGIPAAILFLLAALVGIGRWMGMTSLTAMREGAMMVVVGIAAAVCTIIFMITEGRGYGAGYDKGPLYGAVIGLICAIVIAIDGALLSYEGRSR